MWTKERSYEDKEAHCYGTLPDCFLYQCGPCLSPDGTNISGYYEYISVKSGPFYTSYRAQLMANVRLSRYLNFYADCNHWDGLNRVSGDPRDDPASLTLANATFIAKKLLKIMKDLNCGVYILFDMDWPWPTAQQIPNDWPIPGTNYLFDLHIDISWLATITTGAIGALNYQFMS